MILVFINDPYPVVGNTGGIPWIMCPGTHLHCIRMKSIYPPAGTYPDITLVVFHYPEEVVVVEGVRIIRRGSKLRILSGGGHILEQAITVGGDPDVSQVVFLHRSNANICDIGIGVDHIMQSAVSVTSTVEYIYTFAGAQPDQAVIILKYAMDHIVT